MKLEEALPFLREGKRIYREEKPEDGLWITKSGRILHSCYLTAFDILADDWEIEE